MTRRIAIKGIEFKTVDEAIQHIYASGRGDAIILDGGGLAVAAKAAPDCTQEVGGGNRHHRQETDLTELPSVLPASRRPCSGIHGAVHHRCAGGSHPD